MLEYEIVKNKPVAYFYYKGTSHSHPVRRTVLIIESNAFYLTGYELREGSIVRNLKESPIKTYLKRKIATQDKLGASNHREPGPKKTTLSRKHLFDLIEHGV